MKLEGRLAIITGSGRGIGKAIALAMAREGADIVIADIIEENAKNTAEEIKKLGRNTIAIHADVSKREDVQRIYNETFKIWDKNNVKLILVTNAGITRDALFIKMTDEQWHEVLGTNLTGVFYCCKIFAPVMIENKWGKIINITSIVAKTGNVGQANYSATKAGIIAFTKTLAKELSFSAPITVNCIRPGFIKTPMTDAIPEKVKDMITSRIPLKKMGMPEDIAKAAVFLGSDDGDYMTGTVVEVTGGLDM
ncbi:MAG: beta-ketoacyl-ACP reductase [Candidatus Lokiarchaeota archaeon]|nr:beta-ketoacyl-ACP reductase [Candidatus Lokiarchaeota archaeon]